MLRRTTFAGHPTMMIPSNGTARIPNRETTVKNADRQSQNDSEQRQRKPVGPGRTGVSHLDRSAHVLAPVDEQQNQRHDDEETAHDQRHQNQARHHAGRGANRRARHGGDEDGEKEHRQDSGEEPRPKNDLDQGERPPASPQRTDTENDQESGEAFVEQNPHPEERGLPRIACPSRHSARQHRSRRGQEAQQSGHDSGGDQKRSAQHEPAAPIGEATRRRGLER